MVGGTGLEPVTPYM